MRAGAAVRGIPGGWGENWAAVLEIPEDSCGGGLLAVRLQPDPHSNRDPHASPTDSSLGSPVSQRHSSRDAALPHARAVRVDEPGEHRIDSTRPAEAGGGARAA